MDAYILAEVQDLVNRMTEQLDGYDLSATCNELGGTIDALTNWYVRLSRRRFAGKDSMTDAETKNEQTKNEKRISDQACALQTLHDVLLTLSKLLAPFCPFISEVIYLNLAGEPHGSIHLTDWPESRVLGKNEEMLLTKTRALRTVVSLGLKIRAEQKIGVRRPLQKATIALPRKLQQSFEIGENDLELLREELNVKEIEVLADPGKLATPIAQVDARTVGPRLGAKVQQLIQAGKRGEFKELPDGSLEILGEILSPDEAHILYVGKDEAHIEVDHGFVVSLDTSVNPELTLEGHARTLIRAIQRLRKELGFRMEDRVMLQVEGAGELLQKHGDLILRETNTTSGAVRGEAHEMTMDGTTVTIGLQKE